MLRTMRFTPSISLLTLAPILFLLMWSSGAVMVKLGVAQASVWSFLIARSAISLALTLLLLRVMRGRWLPRLAHSSRATRWNLLGSGLLLQAGYLSTYFLAISSGLSPGLVTVILGLQPLITPLLARQRQSRRAALFLLFGFAGLCLAVAGSAQLGALNWHGIGWALLALAAITVGTICQGRIQLDNLDSVVSQNSIALLIFGAIQLTQPWYMLWNPQLVVALLWMSVVVSTGALLLLMLMLKHQSASQVSVLFYCIPVLTILFDYALFGTTLSVMSWVGVITVAASVWGYQHDKARRAQQVIAASGSA
ncbi:DMT family transporter [Vibrio furnissii]|uniref:DMT family transporter n=1 Tax=Vibrio furnissii TaxID=29494 RepID=UPI000681EFEB|nr:DMT family transporter [Vibrio furnissii]QDC94831.1 DMT family transporter [Vibrio furnissii]UON50270.1 DMT family transporter [Vibrio furnissii]SUQ32515.1 Permease of the drug/metabolite transporter (DMT) superfamily protein [Vibrio furnissii]